MLRHGFFFLNEVHNKILMEEYRYNGTDFTKNKKIFPIWYIIKKPQMVYNSETLMRNIL